MSETLVDQNLNGLTKRQIADFAFGVSKYSELFAVRPVPARSLRSLDALPGDIPPECYAITPTCFF